jgi:ElaB/YqjD/DUF883 family membrane-anchored ribosome-binding protein
MTKPTQSSDGDFAADLAALRQDVAHLAETLSKLVQHQTQDRVQAASSEIEAAIARNPYTAVLIALGVGISIGIMNRSRS